MLDGTTGVITGTPTATQSSTTHTFTVTDDGGTANDAIDIEVVHPAPTIDYAPASITFTRDQAITPITPTSSTSGSPTYGVSPALPAGLTIDPSTGVISGTPSAESPALDYTVTLRVGLDDESQIAQRSAPAPLAAGE